MVRREITYKTENRNTIIYVLLHKKIFDNLNVSKVVLYVYRTTLMSVISRVGLKTGENCIIQHRKSFKTFLAFSS